MKPHEIKILEDRLARYRQLGSRRAAIVEALHRVSEDDATGPHGQSPFTGNTRESRNITSIRLVFSPTLGGAVGVETGLTELQIPASILGDFLRKFFSAQLGSVTAEMEAL